VSRIHRPHSSQAGRLIAQLRLGKDLLVALSCKAPGRLSLVQHRRMHDTDAHLVDAVMPREPMRAVVAIAAAVLARVLS
jgi:hypothetical protein